MWCRWTDTRPDTACTLQCTSLHTHTRHPRAHPLHPPLHCPPQALCTCLHICPTHMHRPPHTCSTKHAVHISVSPIHICTRKCPHLNPCATLTRMHTPHTYICALHTCIHHIHTVHTHYIHAHPTSTPHHVCPPHIHVHSFTHANPPCAHSPNPLHPTPSPAPQLSSGSRVPAHYMGTWTHGTPPQTPPDHTHTCHTSPRSCTSHMHIDPPPSCSPQVVPSAGLARYRCVPGRLDSSSTHVASTHVATLPWAQPWLSKAIAHAGTGMSPQPRWRADGVGIAAMLGGHTSHRRWARSQQPLAQLCQALQWVWGVPCWDGWAGGGRGMCAPCRQRAIPRGCWGGCRREPHAPSLFTPSPQPPWHPVPPAKHFSCAQGLGCGYFCKRRASPSAGG